MRKFLAALLTLCLALTLAAPIAMAEEKVTITFAFWDTNQEPGMKAIAEAYMAEHPNVTVETQVTPWSEYWTKLEAAAQGGALPDVFWMHSNQFFKYVSAGMLLDLTDLNLDYTPYPEGITALYHYEDKQWAVPKDYDTIALYAPMTKDFQMKLTFDEAYELLLEAVAPLGKDYQDVVRSAKDGGWIDVYENKGKTTGAYSNGSAYGVHPYVLLNFRPELDGLLTLAHEMGHAMHSYYSNHTQPFIKSDYTIFVAEVASTCNEVLTINALRKKFAGNQAAQQALIGRLLEGFRTTVFRQTMFA